MKKAIMIFFPALICLITITLSGQTPKTKPVPTLYSTGIGFKGSTFGIPGSILDQFLYEHPDITGYSFGFEIRSYGARGRQSGINWLYSLEFSQMEGTGFWREEEEHWRKNGAGEATQVSLTATVLLNIFPRWVVHPYLGFGLGIEKVSFWAEGSYEDQWGNVIKEIHEEDRVFPVGHIPIGIAAYIGDRFEVRLEGGFKNGFYLGGAVVYLF